MWRFLGGFIAGLGGAGSLRESRIVRDSGALQKSTIPSNSQSANMTLMNWKKHEFSKNSYHHLEN
jgi:hypothetical protein